MDVLPIKNATDCENGRMEKTTRKKTSSSLPSSSPSAFLVGETSRQAKRPGAKRPDAGEFKPLLEMSGLGPLQQNAHLFS